MNDAFVLTIDRAYFDLTGELERWLYRLARKAAVNRRAGASTSRICVSNPAACLLCGASPSKCTELSAANRSPAIGSASKLMPTGHRASASHPELRFEPIGGVP
jgi:plasmid replication initiation protein